MTLDMTEAWREATAMIRANREVLTIIAGLFFFLPSVAGGFALPDMEAVFGDPAAMQAQMMEYYSDWGWLFLLVLLVQVVGFLSMLVLLRDRSRPTVGQAIGAGLKALLPAIGVALVLFVATILLGLVLGLLIGLLGAALGQTASALLGMVLGFGLMAFVLYVAVKLSLWAPVIAVEKVKSPLQVLRRSWRLTRGNSLRLLVFFLLLAVVYLVISIVLGMIFGALSLVLGEVGLIVSAVVSGLVGAVASVIYVAVVAAVHRQLSGPWAAADRAGDEPHH